MTKSVAMNRLAANVRSILSARGMSQRELAGIAGMYEANLNRILQGKEGVTIERAERIATALGISLSDLVSDDSPELLKETA